MKKILLFSLFALLLLPFSATTLSATTLGASICFFKNQQDSLSPQDTFLAQKQTGWGLSPTSNVQPKHRFFPEKSLHAVIADDPIQMLQGQIPGLWCDRAGSDPNEAFTLRIHGLTTMTGDNQPQIRVDGMPVSDLSMLRQEEIESIEVLENASATAIYGAEAASGVVLIKTKIVGRGPWKAAYAGQAMLGVVDKTIPVMNAAEFKMYNGAVRYDNIDTDWIGEILQTGLSHSHFLAVQGGLGPVGVRLSTGFQDRQGILRHSGHRQYQGRLGLDYRAFKGKLRFNADAFACLRSAELGMKDAFLFAVTSNPTIPAKSDSPEFAEYGGYPIINNYQTANALGTIELNKNLGERVQWMGNGRLVWDIQKNLSFDLSFSKHQDNVRKGFFSPKTSEYYGQWNEGYVHIEHEFRDRTFLESTLHWSFKTRGISWEALSGASFNKCAYYGYTRSSTRLTPYNPDLNTLDDIFKQNLPQVLTGDGLNIDVNDSTRSRGLFLRLSAASNDGVLAFNGGIRQEHNPYLANEKSILLPFANGRLNFVKWLRSKLFSDASLHLGYGLAANKGYLEHHFNYADWERKSELNTGISLGNKSGRFKIALNLYKNHCSDLLYSYYDYWGTPTVEGTQKGAKLTNKGRSIAAHWVTIKKARFSWAIGFNTNHGRTVMDSPPEFAYMQTTHIGWPGNGGEFYHQLQKGNHWGDIWVNVEKKVEPNGDIVFGEVKAANAIPTRWWCTQQDFTYKNWQLSCTVRRVKGHNLFNETRGFYENTGTNANMVKTKFFNPNRKYMGGFSSNFIEDASFLRLDNIRLGYRFGAKKQKAMLYLGGQNVVTLTKYTGADPTPRLFDTGQFFAGNFNALKIADPWAAGIDRRGSYLAEKLLYLGVSVGL